MAVISEKPMADTLEAAKAMVTAAVETGLPCVIMQAGGGQDSARGSFGTVATPIWTLRL